MNHDVEAQVKFYIQYSRLLHEQAEAAFFVRAISVAERFDEFFNRSDGGEVNAPACTLELASLNNANREVADDMVDKFN